MSIGIANVVYLDTILLPFADFNRVELSRVSLLLSGSAWNLRLGLSSVVLARSVAEVVSHCFRLLDPMRSLCSSFESLSFIGGLYQSLSTRWDDWPRNGMT